MVRTRSRGVVGQGLAVAGLVSGEARGADWGRGIARGPAFLAVFDWYLQRVRAMS